MCRIKARSCNSQIQCSRPTKTACITNPRKPLSGRTVSNNIMMFIKICAVEIENMNYLYNRCYYFRTNFLLAFLFFSFWIGVLTKHAIPSTNGRPLISSPMRWAQEDHLKHSWRKWSVHTNKFLNNCLFQVNSNHAQGFQ